MSRHSCNACGAPVPPRLEFGAHPIAHRFLDRRDQDELSHPVSLGRCPACQLIQVVTPLAPEELYTDYNWLSSWKWNPQIPRLLELLRRDTDLGPEDSVLEVGSNDGAFLRELAGAGFTAQLGIEPARDASEAAVRAGTDTVHAYFEPALAERLTAERGRFRLLVSRHVLEHIRDLRTFLAAIDVALSDDGWLLLEVPDGTFMTRAPDYSAVWEEHLNYFTPGVLAGLLATVGFQVVHHETVDFCGRALVLLARRAAPQARPTAADDEAHADDFEHFAATWPEFRAALGAYLDARRDAGERLAIYGGGARTCSLINFAGLADRFECVVDDQVEKQGRYLAGARLPILPSSALTERGLARAFLAVNAENEAAVLARQQGFLDGGGRLESLHPPSPRLPEFWRRFAAARSPVHGRGPASS